MSVKITARCKQPIDYHRHSLGTLLHGVEHQCGTGIGQL